MTKHTDAVVSSADSAGILLVSTVSDIHTEIGIKMKILGRDITKFLIIVHLKLSSSLLELIDLITLLGYCTCQTYTDI